MKTCFSYPYTIPFKSVLNLSGLIDYWEVNLDENGTFSGYPAEKIKTLINGAPELRQPIEDLSIVDKHKELVGLLMSVIFPPALIESEIAAAILPFSAEGFYATPRYAHLLPFGKVREDLEANIPKNDIAKGKIRMACLYILNKYYGTNFEIDQPIVISIPDGKTGLRRVYKIDINTQFADVITLSEPQPIDKKVINMLLSNIDDIDLWLKYIDPEVFEFQGFCIMRLTDVTIEEMLSSVKYDLLKKNAVTDQENFISIREKIRSIFGMPNLQLGLSYFDPNYNIISNYGEDNWSSFLMDPEDDRLECENLIDSIYVKAYTDKKPVIIEELSDYDSCGCIENGLLRLGIQNVVIAPLVHEGKVLGIIELGSPEPGKLNALTAAKLYSVLPMFTAAVRRVLSDMQTEVRALIQEECTAIHPTVEWKFIESGFNLMHKRRKGIKAKFEEIVFPKVYPIYGLADIRNSSGERSAAIQMDLINNLEQVKKVIDTIMTYKNIPILDEINFRVEKQIDQLSKGLNSGDESGILEFLREEVSSIFKFFKKDELLRPIINNYEKLLDPNLGVIYNKRKDFEESLTLINDHITTYLDKVEEDAQEIFPHYYEKYKTDGVEYNIYLGGSLVQEHNFDIIYLKNFRLWQLITQCEIAVNIAKLKPSLPRPLDITQLILVHGEPLSIKFRRDEKHFDVDGAYNISYEIVKKRIDKAFIKDSDERLTQPGRLAIVYTQQKEAEEYVGYINYLQSIGYLTENVEFLELEELQGANGLKAIRVEINLNTSAKQFGSDLLKSVLEQIEA
ncbi:GAF domain-containing protein [Fulvivirga sediminis]|uniref:GAF domain-containing protein n=1 Tax=Fulvivirga sediminis TaxID=2803949 RepID=A0A937F4L1_9BACT|nr:GAF domain-containing protein [Fulvivirga sediminis]MBL3654599.1 GAF domain-containing protein [Fulvivirga sediminis]